MLKFVDLLVVGESEFCFLRAPELPKFLDLYHTTSVILLSTPGEFIYKSACKDVKWAIGGEAPCGREGAPKATRSRQTLFAHERTNCAFPPRLRLSHETAGSLRRALMKRSYQVLHVHTTKNPEAILITLLGRGALEPPAFCTKQTSC